MSWAGRTRTLHGELAEVAEVDPRWWLVAGAAAVAESFAATPTYLINDADPQADTFIGHRTAPPADPIADAIVHARAARAAIRELDGTLPGQRLAVVLSRTGAAIVPNDLEVAAFAIGDRVIHARLDDPQLAARLLAGDDDGGSPFVCVTVGDDPIEHARHAHRRAWRDDGGPWLGLGRSGELATVSTCHLVVDGYGHAWLASRIAALSAAQTITSGVRTSLSAVRTLDIASPLGIAWRELEMPSPRALPLAYELGLLLHREAGARAAPFSPTVQIPVAPGHRDDPTRRLRRVMPAVTSVRFEHGEPEPFAVFEARTREILAREASGTGLCARLLVAAQAVPAPLAWKRRSFSAARPRWLDRISDVLGGRACVSRIVTDFETRPSCAVSSPARLATPGDPLGACVVTIMDDGARAAITLCGTGLTGTHTGAGALLDELLANVAP